MTTKKHLQFSRERGFKDYPSIQSYYARRGGPWPKEWNGEIRLAESSIATTSTVYLFVKEPKNLNNPDGTFNDVGILLTVKDAVKLAEQILDLAGKHYHHGYYGALVNDL